jgi:hypothetical protein
MNCSSWHFPARNYDRLAGPSHRCRAHEFAIWHLHGKLAALELTTIYLTNQKFKRATN